MTIGYNKQYGLTVEGAARMGDTLYFVARELNQIFKLNCNNYEIDYVASVPDENGITERLYNGILMNKKRLLLVPYNAEKIWWHDFDKNRWESIDLKGYAEPTLNGKFVGGIMAEEKAYLFGYYYQGVLLVDLKNKNIRNILEKEPARNCSFWGQSVVYKDGVAYVANRVKNEILKIDVDNANYEIVRTPYSNDVYIGIAYDGSCFWIAPHYGSKIYRWDGGQKFCEMELKASFGIDVGVFNGLCANDQYIVLYSPIGKSCIIDKFAGKTETLEEPIFYAEYISEIGFLICRKGSVSFYDGDFRLKKKIEVAINWSKYSEILGKARLTERKLYETTTFGLQEFLWALKEV